MMTMGVATTRIDAAGLGWKKALPTETLAVEPIFSGKALMQSGYAISISKVGCVDFSNAVQLVLQFAEKGFGDEHGAVLVSFPELNVDHAALYIDAFHLHQDALHQTQPGTIEQFGH